MIVLQRGVYFRRPLLQRFRSRYGWAWHLSYKTHQFCVGSRAVVERATGRG